MNVAGIFLLPNGTFIVELVAFLIIVFVLAKYILPPLNAAMEKRQEEIRHSMEAADRARSDAEAIDGERRQELEAARRQAREILEQANRTADQLAADAQAKRQADEEQARRSAEVEIQLARQRAVEEASNRLGDLVVEVVERILRREVDAAAHRDLINEAIGTLSSETPADGGATTGAGQRS